MVGRMELEDQYCLFSQGMVSEQDGKVFVQAEVKKK